MQYPTHKGSPPDSALFKVYLWDDFDYEDTGTLVGIFGSLKAAVAFARASYRTRRSRRAMSDGVQLANGEVGADFMTSWSVKQDGMVACLYLTHDDPNARFLNRSSSAADIDLMEKVRRHMRRSQH